MNTNQIIPIAIGIISFIGLLSITLSFFEEDHTPVYMIENTIKDNQSDESNISYTVNLEDDIIINIDSEYYTTDI